MRIVKIYRDVKTDKSCSAHKEGALVFLFIAAGNRTVLKSHAVPNQAHENTGAYALTGSFMQL
jgi:hypothetical protein